MGLSPCVFHMVQPMKVDKARAGLLTDRCARAGPSGSRLGAVTRRPTGGFDSTCACMLAYAPGCIQQCHEGVSLCLPPAAAVGDVSGNGRCASRCRRSRAYCGYLQLLHPPFGTLRYYAGCHQLVRGSIKSTTM